MTKTKKAVKSKKMNKAVKAKGTQVLFRLHSTTLRQIDAATKKQGHKSRNAWFNEQAESLVKKFSPKKLARAKSHKAVVTKKKRRVKRTKTAKTAKVDKSDPAPHPDPSPPSPETDITTPQATLTET